MRGSCCLENGKEHQGCMCHSNIDVCKSYCDEDIYCKGYVGFISGQHCQIATSNLTCPGGCGQFDVGHVGDLDDTMQCGPPIFDGCFIKSSKLK